MGFLIGLLTFVMVMDCVILIFLVLLQLPKKDAGAGLAFGGSATDALFGAGSGTVLTKITKYAAGTFFVLALLLAFMQSQKYSRSTFEQKLNQAGSLPTESATSSATPTTTTPGSTNRLLSTPSATPAEATNTPAAPVTPAPTTPTPAPATPPAAK
jgi:preprotein translocase subunit SecG